MSLIKEFRDFASRGNVIDLAVGVIMGAAFTSIVKSLVDDIIMPPIGWLVNGIDFKGLSLKLMVRNPDGTPVEIRYGKFLNESITFVIVALAVFALVKTMNTIVKKQEAAPKLTKSEELLIEIRDALKNQPTAGPRTV